MKFQKSKIQKPLKNKSEYYASLNIAEKGWHDEKEDNIPFIKHLLGIMLSAYQSFENRFSIVEKIPALEIVRKATY